MKRWILVTLSLIGSVTMANAGGSNMITAKDVIEKLGLQPLQGEGGYFKETYRCKKHLPAQTVGIGGSGDRVLCTAIYYLLAPNSYSALHRLKSDEIFHFYSGDPAEMIQIDPDGTMRRYVLGSDIMAGQTPQVVVPAGTWQAMRLARDSQWALLGTTVAPGFEFEDFELGDQAKMEALFPEYREDILRFSRAPNESTH